jgi:ATP-dependent Clp protease protease subunit
VEDPTTAPPAEGAVSTEFLATSLDLGTRTLYVADIDDDQAQAFLKGLHLLLAQADDPVVVMLNSRGGDLLHALAIYDAIRTAGVVVTCEILGHCMSAGVIVAQACDRRLIHKHAIVMLHNPEHAHEGDSFSHETWGKWARSTRKLVYQLLANHTGKPAAYWERRCSRGDRLFTAQEALAAGLVDSIIEHDEDM